MKKLMIPLMALVISFILISSFRTLNHDDEYSSASLEVLENVNVDDHDLKVKYRFGNMIDDEIDYGNKVTKVIDIENDFDEDISFAISINDVSLSDEYLKYVVSYAYEDEKFELLSEGSLIGNDNLAYNLVVGKHSKLILKLEFLGNNQLSKTKFTGKLNVVSNLSEKDIYRKNILFIQNEILSNINSLNGINERGYFIVDVSRLTSNDLNKFKGLVLIDATDYSDLKYHYFVSDGKYMLNNYEVVKNEVVKKSILDHDDTIVSGFNFNSVCSMFSKKSCSDFSSLKYNPNGGKNNFYKSSMEVYEKLKSEFKSQENRVIIYDVKKDILSDTDIRGYILVNNMKDNPEYYLYLTNDLYMVTGYNITNLGYFKVDGSTIRSYTETGFNLSSENMSKVCSFSGFADCISASGEKV